MQRSGDLDELCAEITKAKALINRLKAIRGEPQLSVDTQTTNIAASNEFANSPKRHIESVIDANNNDFDLVKRKKHDNKENQQQQSVIATNDALSKIKLEKFDSPSKIKIEANSSSPLPNLNQRSETRSTSPLPILNTTTLEANSADQKSHVNSVSNVKSEPYQQNQATSKASIQTPTSSLLVNNADLKTNLTSVAVIDSEPEQQTLQMQINELLATTAQTAVNSNPMPSIQQSIASSAVNNSSPITNLNPSSEIRSTLLDTSLLERTRISSIKSELQQQTLQMQINALLATTVQAAANTNPIASNQQSIISSLSTDESNPSKNSSVANNQFVYNSNAFPLKTQAQSLHQYQYQLIAPKAGNQNTSTIHSQTIQQQKQPIMMTVNNQLLQSQLKTVQATSNPFISTISNIQMNNQPSQPPQIQTTQASTITFVPKVWNSLNKFAAQQQNQQINMTNNQYKPQTTTNTFVSTTQNNLQINNQQQNQNSTIIVNNQPPTSQAQMPVPQYLSQITANPLVSNTQNFQLPVFQYTQKFNNQQHVTNWQQNKLLMPNQLVASIQNSKNNAFYQPTQSYVLQPSNQIYQPLLNTQPILPKTIQETADESSSIPSPQLNTAFLHQTKQINHTSSPVSYNNAPFTREYHVKDFEPKISTQPSTSASSFINFNLVYKSTSNNPVIQVKAACMFSEHTDGLAYAMSNSESQKLIREKCGSDVIVELNSFIKANRLTYKEWSVADKSFPICVTTAGYLNNIKHVFHVNIKKYNYTNEINEIHFKNTLKCLLNLAIFTYSLESISIPCIGCDNELLYPSFKVARWFDECFDEYFKQNENTCLKTINIYLNNINHVETFQDYFIQKDVKLNKNFDLAKSSDHFTLSLVDTNSEEFQTVCRHFYLTSPRVTITKIEKVENEFLEYMYEKSKEILVKRNPQNETNEYNLFHGTTESSIQAICKFGFNRSYCGKNGVAFGKGVYFARDSVYSDTYSRGIDRSNSRMKAVPRSNASMILARVFVGTYQLGNQSIIEPGLRSDGNQYDSTVDNLANPTIFVIYRDYRAYPNYIIHYQV